MLVRQGVACSKTWQVGDNQTVTWQLLGNFKQPVVGTAKTVYQNKRLGLIAA